MTVSRTGYSGDLGYEIWIDEPDALHVWDTLWDSMEGHGVLPFGLAALYMLRIEAGLLLLDADFDSSRFAWNDAHKSTPIELGWAWMFKDLANDPMPEPRLVAALGDCALGCGVLGARSELAPPLEEHLPVHICIPGLVRRCRRRSHRRCSTDSTRSTPDWRVGSLRAARDRSRVATK